MRIRKLVAFLSIFISLHIYGQEGEKISSDQPDQSAGSSVFYQPANYFINTGLAFNLKM